MNQPSNSLRQLAPEARARMESEFKTSEREREDRYAQLPAIRTAGEAALRRLLPVAQRDTGQSSVVARFLLNLYNGNRFPFDNTDLRRLDYELFDDCMAVLKMDFQPAKEVHRYVEHGTVIWEALADDWNIKDHGGKDWRNNPVKS